MGNGTLFDEGDVAVSKRRSSVSRREGLESGWLNEPIRQMLSDYQRMAVASPRWIFLAESLVACGSGS